MKKMLKYIGGCITAIILCAVMLGALCLPTSAEPVSLPSLQYGIAGREDNVLWDAETLYRELFGTDPTEGEIAYLESRGVSFCYNQSIPEDHISTQYDADAGILTVEIRPYIYTAENGERVTWIPERLIVDGVECTMQQSGEIYLGRVEGLLRSDDFELSVDYTWRVTIPESVIREMRLSAFEVGESSLSELLRHENANRTYYEQLAAHESWNAYLEWRRQDDIYRAELAAYEAARNAYDAYCEAMDRYDADMATIRAWELYFDADARYAEEHKAYAAYATYERQFNKIKERLALMDSIYVADSRGWQLYASIMGGTVDKVLENKELLIDKLLIDAKYVNGAGEATEALRKLLPKYYELKNASYPSEHARVAALHAFYAEHHDALSREFTKLYTALRVLFNEATVRLTLSEQGKIEHYKQFVGQLYVVSTCLDESSDRDPNWIIGDDERLTDVVEKLHIFPDGVWTVKGLSMPAEVPFVKEPVKPTAPTTPMPDRPIKPAEVAPPPEKPVEPDNPYADGKIPPETAHPGTPPAPPVLSDTERALAAEVKDGILVRYTGELSPMELEFQTTLTRPVSIRNLKTLTFYDHNGNVYRRENVEYGSSFFLRVPERAETAEFIYTAKGWCFFDGSDATASLQTITSDLSLYPSYEVKKQRYEVTWILGEERATMWFDYGEYPTVPYWWSLESYEIGHYQYTFSGWDHEILPVTGHVTYRGEMVETPKQYRVTWILYGGKTVEEYLPALTVPAFGGETFRPADAYSYQFEGWDLPITELTRDMTYRAVYTKTKLAVGVLGGTVLPLTHTETEISVAAKNEMVVDLENLLSYAAREEKGILVQWENGLRMTVDQAHAAALSDAGFRRVLLKRSTTSAGYICYEVSFQNTENLELVTLPVPVRLHLPLSQSTLGETLFYISTANGDVAVEGATVNLMNAVKVIERFAYRLKPTANQHCNTMVLPALVSAGETVSLKLSCVFGYEITGAEVLDAYGNAVPVSADLSFVMPASAVTVTLKTEPIRYTVIFRVDGVVVSQKEYAPGETIVLPKDPEKAPQDGYTYHFNGWGEVPVIAGGDERTQIYDAAFTRARTNVDYAEGIEGNLFLKVWIPILSGILLLIIGLVVWRILRRRKKKRAAQAEAEEPVEEETEEAATETCADDTNEASDDSENNETTE